jgi:hypothetical protein
VEGTIVIGEEAWRQSEELCLLERLDVREVHARRGRRKHHAAMSYTHAASSGML